MAATYDVYLGIAKEPAFDWRAEGAGLEQISLTCRLASGLQQLLEVARAIERGELEGRELDWGAWIAPIRKSDLLRLPVQRGWMRPPEIEDLPDEGSYYLVAVEG